MTNFSDVRDAFSESSNVYLSKDLKDLYALLVLVKGEECTVNDIKNAWAAKYDMDADTRPCNDELAQEIHWAVCKAARTLKSRENLPPEPDMYSAVLIGPEQPLTMFRRFPPGWHKVYSWSDDPTEHEYPGVSWTWPELNQKGTPMLLMPVSRPDITPEGAVNS